MAGESVRQLILAKIVANMTAMAPPAYPFTFSSVVHGPLDMGAHKSRFMAGIVPGRENKRDLFPIMEIDFPINIEFRATRQKNGDSPGLLAEQVLTQIQQCIYADKTMGGLAVDTVEIGNEIDLDTYGDDTVVGVMYIRVNYRHSHKDVTNPYPEV